MYYFSQCSENIPPKRATMKKTCMLTNYSNYKYDIVKLHLQMEAVSNVVHVLEKNA